MKSSHISAKKPASQEYQHIIQPFAPVFDAHSRILILGSFPSVKSREGGFYYHHPQNRFWKVLATVLEVPVPGTIEEKKNMLLSHGIAIWDVIESCDIIGSSDSSIKNVIPADLRQITEHAPIRQVCTNGGTAGRLYDKYCLSTTGLPATKLPSTSPANAAWSLKRLTEVWKREVT
ncbi:MAG: DNA-deoxyinosine glycosylase [Lachnospiraceae bacterium]|nr:DNA-deoxyinosine glycosylase [Lachnospiraceae bacterium]